MVMAIMTYLWAFCGFFSELLLLLHCCIIALMLQDFRVVSTCSTFWLCSTISIVALYTTYQKQIDLVICTELYLVRAFDLIQVQIDEEQLRIVQINNMT